MNVAKKQEKEADTVDEEQGAETTTNPIRQMDQQIIDQMNTMIALRSGVSITLNWCQLS